MGNLFSKFKKFKNRKITLKVEIETIDKNVEVNEKVENEEIEIIDKDEVENNNIKTIEYLPVEMQLLIIKNLERKELLEMERTNQYFHALINNYNLTLKKFKSIDFRCSAIFEHSPSFDKCYEMKTLSEDFPMEFFREKWKSLVDKNIPVFLTKFPNALFQPCIVFDEELPEEKVLKLPLYPDRLLKFQFVRYWIKNLFVCDFDMICFTDHIFNPEMIKLLFNSEEISQMKFKCNIAIFYLIKILMFGTLLLIFWVLETVFGYVMI
ncbi:F-box domain-containing protein [Meloidogyne graminicola]|uniref:F-box domain-containing protein n=1 Tax=Meloidogyne graminicola TaxID=189291 RepID=A0A8S9ZTT3_9BILA|nr:F-box domain-containing protein [Meloidogyne graminicola]